MEYKLKNRKLITFFVVLAILFGALAQLNFDGVYKGEKNANLANITNSGSIFTEDFEWGAISVPNSYVATWEPILMENGIYTGWMAKQYNYNNQLINLSSNFVNTTNDGGSTTLHMENIADSYAEYQYSNVMVLADMSESLDDFTIEATVIGNRTEPGDSSYIAIHVYEDTNGDGIYNDNQDYNIRYIIDSDGLLDGSGAFDGLQFGRLKDAWYPIASDWDGMTWHHLSINITQDWLDYWGYSLSSTNDYAIMFENSLRVSGGLDVYRTWSSWDNLTVNGISITIPSINLPPGASIITDYLSTDGLILWVNLLNGATLSLDFSSSSTLLGLLPAGLRPAKDNFYTLTINQFSSVVDGHGRIYYDQADLANQVYENELTVLYWNDTSLNWIDVSIDLNKSENYVDFDIVGNGNYLFAGKPKHNYDILIYIIIIGSAGGIVLGISISKFKKKKTAATIKQKKTLPNYSKSVNHIREDVRPDTQSEVDRIRQRAFLKREKLLRIGQTIPDKKFVDNRNQNPKKVMKFATKQVDISKRALNADEMESQVGVEEITPICIVHKGKIKGFSYSCKECGAIYCMDCFNYLRSNQEICWNCQSILDN